MTSIDKIEEGMAGGPAGDRTWPTGSVHELRRGHDAPLQVASRPRCQSGLIDLFDHFGAETEMWTGTGERSISRRVLFARPFSHAPQVLVSVTMIDAAREQNTRYDIRALDVSRDGFTVSVRTWNDTRIARLSASWMAVI